MLHLKYSVQRPQALQFICIAIVFLCIVSPAQAFYSVSDKGTWPDTWPKELEPLRDQAETLQGPTLPYLHYHITFEDRAKFEAAWPHLLKLKSKGAPVILLRSPYTWLGNIKAGVLVHTPPKNQALKSKRSETAKNDYLHDTYIELIVDGDIVDLNRIPFPADTRIIDKRFEKIKKKAVKATQPKATKENSAPAASK
ncbi:MAG: hypothetical protein COA78_23320 [Blastopirellula sp.]|nr:MAG: hypothetical protein COA78_23320 [Blastopirellula sp.]